MEEILLLHKFFPIVDMRLSCEEKSPSGHHRTTLSGYSPTKLSDGAQMTIFGNFLRPVLSASRAQHVSDMHSKFARKYGRHPISDAEIRPGKKKEEEEITG